MEKTYGWCLDDSACLDDFLLVHLGSRSVKVTDNSGHAGLVAHETSEVDGLLGVILGETIKRYISKCCYALLLVPR